MNLTFLNLGIRSDGTVIESAWLFDFQGYNKGLVPRDFIYSGIKDLSVGEFAYFKPKLESDSANFSETIKELINSLYATDYIITWNYNKYISTAKGIDELLSIVPRERIIDLTAIRKLQSLATYKDTRSINDIIYDMRTRVFFEGYKLLRGSVKTNNKEVLNSCLGELTPIFDDLLKVYAISTVVLSSQISVEDLNKLQYKFIPEVEFTYGKYKGQKIKDILVSDRQYLEWLLNTNLEKYGFDKEKIRTDNLVLTLMYLLKDQNQA